MLNELKKDMLGVIAPTDSRFRPDIRKLENGDIGDFNDFFLLFLKIFKYIFLILIN